MKFRIPLFLILTCLCLVSAELRAEKTDIVYLHNGDRITGEVKGVYSGQLEFKTDDVGVLMINWSAIRELISDEVHQVKLSDGGHLTGELSKPVSPEENEQSLIVVKTASTTERIESNSVVSMYPLGADFWDRIDFDLSLGFNYDKASSVGKYNMGINTMYRAENYVNIGKLSSEITTQNTADNTKRNVLSALHMADRPNKRYHSYFGNLEQNDQLGIDLRTVLGVGYGWVPISTSAHWLTMGGGIQVNLERPFDDTDPDENLEAVASLRYQHYKHSVPKRNIDAYFQIMPSLTQSDRIRADFTLDFKWEVVRSFYIGMEFYTSFDSQPPSPEASDIDYGLISSVGYSY
ncbi:MAG: DUF481 domain-containing protein [Halioglobus sp.]